MHGAGEEALGGISGFRTSRAAQGLASEGLPVGTTLIQLGDSGASPRHLGQKCPGPWRWLSPSLGRRGWWGCGQSHTNLGICGKKSHALPHRQGWEYTGCPEDGHPFPDCDSVLCKECSPSTGSQKALHIFERNMSMCLKSGQ